MNKNVVRILSLVVVLSMMLTAVAFAAPSKNKFGHFDKKYELKFDDYENALKSLVDKEIVKGYGNGDYGLSGNVKRGDVIVMIIRMLEKYEKIDVDLDDVKDVFEDVNRYEYFYDSVAKAKKLGIAKGDGKFFNPNKPVTVQETIWLIERAGDELGLDVDDSIIEDLEEIYEGELDKFAKRRDVFWMLYFVLDMVEQDEPDDAQKSELDDIKLKMDRELKFKDTWFADVYEDLMDEDSDVEALKYIKFDLPVNNAKLYYNYVPNDDDNELVEEGTKYYLGDGTPKLDKITLVSSAKFSGTITVKYFAVDEDGETYIGYMKIAVDNDEVLDDVSYQTDENKAVAFDKDDFEDFIDKVRFVLPDSKVGKLYLDKDNDDKPENDELLGSKTDVKYNELDNIIFVPYLDFDGKATIKYTATKYVDDADDEIYSGKVVVTVKEVQEIANLKFTPDLADESYKIDIVEELEDLLDDDLFEDFDYIKFSIPEKGTLKIKLDENRRAVSVSKDSNYNIKDIEYIQYEYTEAGKITLSYAAYDDGKAYDGNIILEID